MNGKQEVTGRALKWKIKLLLPLPFIGQNRQNSLKQKEKKDASIFLENEKQG